MIQFRLLNHDDIESFLQLHNVLFKRTKASKEWIDWYFYEIGRSKTRVYGAFDGGDIVGCWCVEPKKLKTNGDLIDVGRCFAVGIRDDHRMKGLFVELSVFAINHEKTIGEYEYVLGFPQVGKPVISGHIKAGWDRIHSISALQWNVVEPTEFTSLSSVEKIQDFCHVRTPELECNGFIESSHYRNSRWLYHPDNNYICLSSDTSYVVLKPYGQICHILDVRGESDSVKTLLNATKTLAYRHGWSAVTTWCADNEQFAWEINDAGFVPGSDYCLSIEMLSVKINAGSSLAFQGNTHFMQCVEEIY